MEIHQGGRLYERELKEMFSIFMMGKNYSRVHSTHIILCTLNLRTRLKLSILRQECKKYEYNYIIHQNSAQVREECTLLCTNNAFKT